MTSIASQLLKAIGLSLAALILVGASHQTARADEVTIIGSTTGIVTGVPQLTFVGNEFFTGTTALGLGSLSGANSLGSFFLSTAPTQLLSGSFDLNVIFTAPAGIAFGQTTIYRATIVGSVSPNVDQGGVNVHFTFPTHTFPFNDLTNHGSFSLTVADVFVQTGRSANVTAGISGQQTPVPEPATMLLLGSGLTGVAVKLRRRRNAKRQLLEKSI